ncbi:MAG TPA: DoxX family protein [Bacteroidales bacterium]|nr:DoxX family protein [Bacteroidales bacterium]
MKIKTRPEWTKIIITILRVGIGWHFLYEGVVKLFSEKWSAYSYLANTTGVFSGFYHWLANSPVLLKVVDLLNIYGLILIGLALFAGYLIRIAAISGVVLLTLYYFAYPPFGVSFIQSSEGHFYIVDRIFIEAVALLFITFLKNPGYGLYAISSQWIKNSKTKHIRAENKVRDTSVNARREAIRNLATVPLLGLMGWGAMRRSLKVDVDVMSGATIQIKQASLSELKGVLPKGKIGNHEISRLVLGGNLIGGWAHARDLIYVPSLFKAYNTEKKVYETLMLAEQAGINTINIGFPSNELLVKYKKYTGSKIKVITHVEPNMDNGDIYEFINKGIDFGVDIFQIQGGWCDRLVRDQKIDVIEKMMEKIRSQGYTAGLASHTIDSLIACEGNGIIPDYYMKTMHHDRYWSAHSIQNRVPFEVDGEKSSDHNKFHDNLFCLYPERTIEFVNRVKLPVMGYKVLAAGAIEPKDGFRWAFENGADFICVGMFDFQIVENVNTTLEILGNLNNRKREWFG